MIEAGARLERTTVRGPAMIGAGAQLTDAYIGPYTAIGDDVKIENAELEHSIVMSGSSHLDLDGPHRGEPDRQEREDPPRAAAAEGVPLRGRRQRRRADSLDVAVRRAERGERHEQKRVEAADEPGHDRLEQFRGVVRPRR